MTPSATLPAGGLRGEQDLLRLMNAVQSPDWTADQFTHGEDGEYWRLGVGAAVPNGTVITSPSRSRYLKRSTAMTPPTGSSASMPKWS